ncbi:MAG TPA: UDP-N-acetylmuramate--L-alanine ligase [Patescibacteria group bacterium]|jgi:UDP-N-acetylmuramate--alanine ligase|nr:UDP-N-acetylmuramate--L-alanine ligase [Patescibacteria group bacterium]
MNKIKNIHFLGIKGVGMTPLAIIAKEAGFKVSGCDLDEEFITDAPLERAGIKSLVGFSEEHLLACDLLITTGAHGGFENIEVIKAKQLGIPVWTQGQAVGKFMDGELLKDVFEGISVAGSHGKTTTSAMIATILKENKQDPTFLIGTGDIPSLGSSGHFGKGKYFVAEADEYATEPKYDKTPKFLWQHPQIGVITNIEFDHPDLYSSMEQLREAFLNFAKNIKSSGVLVAGIDDPETVKMIKQYTGKVITYGFSESADFNLQKVSIAPEKTFFWVRAKDTLLGEFSLNIAGEYNALNALAAIVVCLELGLSVENIKRDLLVFKGTKRRSEFVGKTASGALIYDDYAHHPTEIKNTLGAFRKIYPNKKIVCIFQPHTYSRTKSLFEQFKSSFNFANELILTDIFPSLREVADNTVSSELLASSVAKIQKDVLYIARLEDVIKYLEQKNFNDNYIIITMGAGDVYKIGKELINE